MPGLPQRRTLGFGRVVVACRTGKMELRIQALFEVVQTGCLAKLA